VIDLPNNLVGFAALIGISDKVTERVESILATEDDNEESPDVSIKDYLFVGQYVRTHVISTSDASTEGGKIKKRLELSLYPSLANSGLKERDVIVNSSIQGSVVSVEDHGAVIELGIAGSKLSGFLPNEEMPETWQSQPDLVKEGAVLLCFVTSKESSRAVRLSAVDHSTNKHKVLKEALTIDSFKPGTAFEGLITEVSSSGIAAKIMGSLDVTADFVHSGLSRGVDITKQYRVGKKIQGRIIYSFGGSDSQILGFSVLEHIFNLSGTGSESKDTNLHASSIVEDTKVTTVVKEGSGAGLYVDIQGFTGYVHISRIADEKADVGGSRFKPGTIHSARVLGYNSVDSLYLLTLEPKILAQRYLVLDDVKPGDLVKGTIDKLIVTATGFGGALIKISENIVGLVPEAHLADVKLLHPERKFRPGLAVSARVLSVDKDQKRVRLTLKKTLVNSEFAILDSFDKAVPGTQSPGTITRLLPSGAVVEFYGFVKGFLPVSEMSEAFIEDPREHFKEGQVVNVFVISSNPAERKLQLSCKVPSEKDETQEAAFAKVVIGSIVTGTVLHKTQDDVQISVDPSGIKGVILSGQLTDGTGHRNANALAKLKVGQTLTDIIVIEKVASKKLLVLSLKQSLIEESRLGRFLTSFEEVQVGKTVKGFVKNIIPSGVFIGFAAGLTGLVLKNSLPEKLSQLPDFGLKRFQSVSAIISSRDSETRRFLLSMKEASNTPLDNKINALDPTIEKLEDITVGRITKARIVSVKATQLNVRLAGDVQGRVDVSQVFDTWEQIEDAKRPLSKFRPNDIIEVRVLGVHDARNHRFLPISHRSAKNPVFELTAKPSDLTSPELKIIGVDQLEVGAKVTAFVNNVSDDGLWVNISPNLRGRIKAIDAADNLEAIQEMNFPVGSALHVAVIALDKKNNRIDLSARENSNQFSVGSIVPGRVTKVQDLSVMVQLSDAVSGRVHITDIADDYDLVNTDKLDKNEIVPIYIFSDDDKTGHLSLSMRPSQTQQASTSKDKRISSPTDLAVNQVIRGFIKNISDQGLFISLSPSITAYARVSDLSDSFIKDWKSMFKVGQLVRGKLIVANPTFNQIQISLKESVIDSNYKAPMDLSNLKEGQIITGVIRKVEDFGVFVLIDNSSISALCHKTEMADEPVEPKKIYSEGDKVKAKVLKIDITKRRVSLGLKMAYIAETEDENDEDDSSDELEDSFGGVALHSGGEDEDEDDEMADIEDEAERDILSESEASDENHIDELENSTVSADVLMKDAPESGLSLKAQPFDWTGGLLDNVRGGFSDSDADSVVSFTADQKKKKQKKKKSRTEIQQDLTSLDEKPPSSPSDFERLLLSNPDSAYLWVSYMAHHLSLSEVDPARQVARRALSQISSREEESRLDVETALLNLENAFGSPESFEAAYTLARQRNDERLSWSALHLF
jgi:rRNA biogenesis protein RRP5